VGEKIRWHGEDKGKIRTNDNYAALSFGGVFTVAANILVNSGTDYTT
jgi:hypothetical protein